MPAPKNNKYALGNKGGRPRLVEKKDLPQLGEDLVEFLTDKLNTLDQHKSPAFIIDFALSRKLAHWNLTDYCDVSKEFSTAYKKAKDIVKRILMQGGLKGYFNPTAFIFVSKNETDMKDKQEVEHTGFDSILAALRQ